MSELLVRMGRRRTTKRIGQRMVLRDMKRLNRNGYEPSGATMDLPISEFFLYYENLPDEKHSFKAMYDATYFRRKERKIIRRPFATNIGKEIYECQ